MPELKSVSPILDGLLVGQCFSEHDGVKCYPAIRQEDGEKYIIKVVCIPSSSVQTDALLLSGAIASKEEAMPYYKRLAEEVTQEAQTLNALALLEGFAGCEQVQCEESEDGEGYAVYLLTPYRVSMEAVFRQEALTHLDAINMGMDLCAALAACRRAGFMFIDLKPDNVYRMDNGSYCIGDIGFIRLNNMQFASLAQKYRSSYTAPEMADCLAQPNGTLDIYALGLMLYQAYNGGVLPFEGNAPDTQLEPPLYADYELSEIILKACARNPADRWEDPAQIGQALAAYMQRNSVNATPIVPVEEAVAEPEADVQEAAEPEEEFLPEMTDEELREALLAEEDTDGEQDEIRAIAALAAQDDISVLPDAEEALAEASDEETAGLLEQAEELMTLTPPEPVVAPEAIHVEIPVADVPAEAAADAEAAEPVQESASEAAPAVPVKKKRSYGKLVVLAIVLILLAGIGLGSYYYYNNYYLQHIDGIQIAGTDDAAIVAVLSEIDDSLLTVICTDSYGNTHTGTLQNGKAVFENLKPQTRYNIAVSISGFHELRGETTSHFTTASRTEIMSFQAVVGPVDGSAIVSFATTGPVPESWTIVCTAPGQETVSQSFTGNTVTVTDLEVGSEYTFSLIPSGDLYLAGQTEVSFLAVKVILAQNAMIDSCQNGRLHVSWAAPEGEMVESWTVRCFNAAGYDVSITTAELEYTFEDVDLSADTAVEITAAGMTKSVTTSVGANPITIETFDFAQLDGSSCGASWTFTGKEPEGGWILNWSLDGVQQKALTCSTNAVSVPLYVPGGNYEFTLVAADGRQLFNSSFAVKLPDAKNFSAYGLKASKITCRSFQAPDKTTWTYKDVKSSAYREEFELGEKIYLMLSTKSTIESSKKSVEILYVIRSKDGSSIQTYSESQVWNSLWNNKYCILELPAISLPGSYECSLYINGMIVKTVDVTVNSTHVPLQ